MNNKKYLIACFLIIFVLNVSSQDNVWAPPNTYNKPTETSSSYPSLGQVRAGAQVANDFYGREGDAAQENADNYGQEIGRLSHGSNRPIKTVTGSKRIITPFDNMTPEQKLAFEYFIQRETQGGIIIVSGENAQEKAKDAATQGAHANRTADILAYQQASINEMSGRNVHMDIDKDKAAQDMRAVMLSSDIKQLKQLSSQDDKQNKYNEIRSEIEYQQNQLDNQQKSINNRITELNNNYTQVMKYYSNNNPNPPNLPTKSDVIKIYNQDLTKLQTEQENVNQHNEDLAKQIKEVEDACPPCKFNETKQ